MVTPNIIFGVIVFGKKKKSEFEIISNQIAEMRECLEAIEFFLCKSVELLGVIVCKDSKDGNFEPDLNIRLANSFFVKFNGQNSFLSLGSTTDLKGINYYIHTSVYFILNGLDQLQILVNSENFYDNINKITKTSIDILLNVIFLKIWLNFGVLATSSIKNKDIATIKKIRVDLQNEMVEALDKLSPQALSFVNFRKIGEQYWKRIPYISIEVVKRQYPEYFNLPMNEVAKQDLINYFAEITFKSQISRAKYS